MVMIGSSTPAISPPSRQRGWSHQCMFVLLGNRIMDDRRPSVRVVGLAIVLGFGQARLEGAAHRHIIRPCRLEQPESRTAGSSGGGVCWVYRYPGRDRDPRRLVEEPMGFACLVKDRFHPPSRGLRPKLGLGGSKNDVGRHRNEGPILSRHLGRLPGRLWRTNPDLRN